MRAVSTETPNLTTALHQHIVQAIQSAGGWIGFDRFMALALYTPGLGYYANDSTKFGLLPQSGSDFVTAPELSPLFGQTLAVQVAEALERTGTHEVWEFGAGSGALALQLLDTLGAAVQRYTIVDLSGSLRARQQTLLAAHADKVRWLDALPAQFEGVVVGNEVLDAMPVQLLARHGGAQDGAWHERGVALDDDDQFIWADQATALRPPLEIEGPHDYLTEIHVQAEAFIHTLGDRLTRGAAFFIDYGFGESEYYHPQRHMGTVMCHRAHQSDDNPLLDVGLKDITAHVNFTAMALAAQDQALPAGQNWSVLGYTTQAHFLINCGIAAKLDQQALAQRVQAAKLLMEHEMGELFKVLALCKGQPWDAVGFARGDRTHRL
ncbi:MAG: SAM-dependent methyltransferase [Giesbergeria sp.]|uniref:class I SAM-dependent methyltransferase n=1 Tax=Giesbergeria sp. TaxID=2818473 RepID=UPI002617912F|nr:SAM-dependent methyltransferase [Giesbergeria sp.]MDD2610537.1 SAM-dependent methyltransferase [Giesbergeria sp.]